MQDIMEIIVESEPMAFQFFHQHLPELARKETRTVAIIQSDDGLPDDEYGFLEMYCDEKGCDCRRVLFSIFSRRQRREVAVLSWGWESTEFYFEWIKRRDWGEAQAMSGISINPLAPQTELAPRLLELLEVILEDPAYRARIVEHYRLFRQKIECERPRRESGNTARNRMKRMRRR